MGTLYDSTDLQVISMFTKKTMQNICGNSEAITLSRRRAPLQVGRGPWTTEERAGRICGGARPGRWGGRWSAGRRRGFGLLRPGTGRERANMREREEQERERCGVRGKLVISPDRSLHVRAKDITEVGRNGTQVTKIKMENVWHLGMWHLTSAEAQGSCLLHHATLLPPNPAPCSLKLQRQH